MKDTAALEKGLTYAIGAGTFLLLLMPLFVTTDTIFPFIVGKAIFARLIIEILFGLWLVLAFLSPSYRLPRSRLLLIFAVYVVIALLAGVFGVSFQRSLWSTYERMQGIVDLAHWLVLVVILVSVFRLNAFWKLLLNLNLVVSLIAALLGIAQHFDATSIPFYEFLKASPRVDSTLGNPTFVGAYMLVNIFIAIGFLTQSFASKSAPSTGPTPARRRRRRAQRDRSSGNYVLLLMRSFWVVAAILTLWVMTLTGTRGAFAGFLAGLLLFGVAYISFGKLRQVKIAAAALLLGLVLAGAAFFAMKDSPIVERIASSNVLVERLTNVNASDAPIKSRLLAFYVGLEAFKEKPLLGWGPENYLIAFGRFFTEDRGTPETLDQAHNKPLEELTTKGILGLASYVGLWVALFWYIVRAVRDQPSNDQFFNLFVGAALVGYFVQSLFLFDTPATVLQLMLLIGFVTHLEISCRQSVSDSVNRRGFEPHKDSRADLGMRLVLSNALTSLGTPSWRWLPLAERVRGLINSNVIWRRSAFIVGIAAILGIIGAGIFFANIRAYNAATALLKVANENNTAEQHLENFAESIDSFGPLANYPRLILFEALAENWNNLTAYQADNAISLVTQESHEALATEPENWRIHLSLAKFYRMSTSIEPGNMALAKDHLERAQELAPERQEVLRLVRQFETQD